MTDAAAAATSSAEARPSRRRVVVAAALGAVLVAGAAAYLVRPDFLFGPQAEAGELLPQSNVGGRGNQATVQLPWGSLRVSAGEPVEQIPDDAVSERFDASYDQVDPPRGGAWLPVHVEQDTELGEVLFRAKVDATIPATTITLRTGGHTVALARSGGGSGTATTAQRLQAQLAPDVEGYLALPDGYDRDDLVARIEFDGVRQDVDLTTGTVTSGRAGPLYRPVTRNVDLDCGPATVPGYRVGTDRADCGITRIRPLPFVAGLGWARAGRTWLVVTATTKPPYRVIRGGVTFTARLTDTARSSLRYGATAPLSQIAYNRVSSSVFVDVDQPTQFLYDLPVGDTGRRADYTLTTTFTPRTASGATETLTATRTITTG